jgi:hypothetical protein
MIVLLLTCCCICRVRRRRKHANTRGRDKEKSLIRMKGGKLGKFEAAGTSTHFAVNQFVLHLVHGLVHSTGVGSSPPGGGGGVSAMAASSGGRHRRGNGRGHIPHPRCGGERGSEIDGTGCRRQCPLRGRGGGNTDGGRGLGAPRLGAPSTPAALLFGGTTLVVVVVVNNDDGIPRADAVGWWQTYQLSGNRTAAERGDKQCIVSLLHLHNFTQIWYNKKSGGLLFALITNKQICKRTLRNILFQMLSSVFSFPASCYCSTPNYTNMQIQLRFNYSRLSVKYYIV